MIKSTLKAIFSTILFFSLVVMVAYGNKPPVQVEEQEEEAAVELAMEDQILPSFEECEGLPGNSRMNCNFDHAYPSR